MGGYGSSYDYSTDESVTKKSAMSYNIDQKREYKVEEEGKLPPPKDKIIVTKAKFPVAIAVDVTGSMRTLPKLIFEKLCILYNEALYFLPEKLKDSFEISFSAIGDANTDNYPLQITDFGKGFELDRNIKSLFPEGGGGGQARETYELTAYYYAYHCKLIKPLKNPRPMFFFIGDEGFYSKVNRSQISNLIGNPPKTDLISSDVFNDLKKKFEVYILRIKYESEKDELEIHKMWQDVLGSERAIMLYEPRRVVDTILGLIAANVDRFDKFKERIEIRQTPEQVDQVYSTLHGLKSQNKSYVYKTEVMKCPYCDTILEKIPEVNSPGQCPYCGVLFVRI